MFHSLTSSTETDLISSPGHIALISGTPLRRSFLPPSRSSRRKDTSWSPSASASASSHTRLSASLRSVTVLGHARASLLRAQRPEHRWVRTHRTDGTDTVSIAVPGISGSGQYLEQFPKLFYALPSRVLRVANAAVDEKVPDSTDFLLMTVLMPEHAAYGKTQTSPHRTSPLQLIACVFTGTSLVPVGPCLTQIL